MKASAVIPCYSLDRIGDIGDAVKSVLSQTRKPDEVIVAVDHHRSLAERIRRDFGFAVKVVENNGIKGSAETRNAGIRASSGDVVAFIDDDAVAEVDWMEKLLGHYNEPNVVAVGGRIISIWRNGRPGWFPEELDWIVGGTYKGFAEAQGEVRNLLWPNMSFRRNVCERIGYVRTDMGALGGKARAGDETEFCMRMRRLIPGARIVYEPQAVVCHKTNKTTFGHLVGRSFGDGRCKGKASRIFHGLSDRAFSTEKSYLRFLLLDAIPGRLRRGKLSQAGAMALSILAFGMGFLRGRL